MENTPKTRSEILATALEAREQEVLLYQINIDNYTLALGEIAKLSKGEQDELDAFTNQIRGLLTSEILEQKKANIMLSVLRKQME